MSIQFKKKSKQKKSKRLHVAYNKKKFLAPNSIHSMSAMFTKIYDDGTAIIRISDCNNTIKLWNNINEKSQTIEMLQKIDTIMDMLQEFREEIKIKLPINQ